MSKVWRVFWYRPNRFFINFGDEITPVLLKYYGLKAKRAKYAEAELFSTGTILGWEKTEGAVILGSGMDSHAKYKPDIKKNKIYGVRGRNAAKLLGIDPKKIALGDPGLLMPRVVQKPEVKYRIGVVPNSADWQRAKQLYADLPVKIICPHRPTLFGVNRQTCQVVREIASCRMILSTSLHGNIIADAYGIPNAHITLGEKVSEEKFRDYFSIYSSERYNSVDGQELKVPEDMEAHVKKVYKPVKSNEMKEIQNDIESMFMKLKEGNEL